MRGGSDSNLHPSLKLPAKSSKEHKALQVEEKGLNQNFHVMKQQTYPWHFNHFIFTLYRMPCLRYSMNSSSRKWNTLLTHIQHGAGVVGRDGLVK